MLPTFGRLRRRRRHATLPSCVRLRRQQRQRGMRRSWSCVTSGTRSPWRRRSMRPSWRCALRNTRWLLRRRDTRLSWRCATRSTHSLWRRHGVRLSSSCATHAMHTPWRRLHCGMLWSDARFARRRWREQVDVPSRRLLRSDAQPRSPCARRLAPWWAALPSGWAAVHVCACRAAERPPWPSCAPCSGHASLRAVWARLCTAWCAPLLLPTGPHPFTWRAVGGWPGCSAALSSWEGRPTASSREGRAPLLSREGAEHCLGWRPVPALASYARWPTLMLASALVPARMAWRGSMTALLTLRAVVSAGARLLPPCTACRAGYVALRSGEGRPAASSREGRAPLHSAGCALLSREGALRFLLGWRLTTVAVLASHAGWRPTPTLASCAGWRPTPTLASCAGWRPTPTLASRAGWRPTLARALAPAHTVRCGLTTALRTPGAVVRAGAGAHPCRVCCRLRRRWTCERPGAIVRHAGQGVRAAQSRAPRRRAQSPPAVIGVHSRTQGTVEWPRRQGCRAAVPM